MTTKPGRIAARLSVEQDEIIRRAAEVEGSTLTEFAVSATMAHAREVLADQRIFLLSEPSWAEFNALLDAPAQHKPRLSKLLTEPSVFDR